MDSKLEKMARTGYGAKAVVYTIMGVLTFMAAFNLGGQTTGQLQVIEFLEKQTFGNILLILIGIGLLAYSTWRFIQSIKDPENIGSDTKGKAKRTGFFISGLIYLVLAIVAIMNGFGSGSSGGSNGGNGMMDSVLTGQLGVIIFGIIGAGLVFTGIFQLKKAFSKEFLEDFDYNSITEEKRRKIIKNTGYLGLIARGIIFGIMAYIFIRAAIESNTSDIKSTTDAFEFLRESSMGAWLMGTVAAGFVCYGIYTFMMARYRKFKG